MSTNIKCASIIGDTEGNVITSLYVPRAVVDRLNAFEDTMGEQKGAEMRDRLLSALAAMVIQSLDEFRVSDMFKRPTLIEGKTNGDKSGN